MQRNFRDIFVVVNVLAIILVFKHCYSMISETPPIYITICFIFFSFYIYAFIFFCKRSIINKYLINIFLECFMSISSVVSSSSSSSGYCEICKKSVSNKTNHKFVHSHVSKGSGKIDIFGTQLMIEQDQ